MLIIVTSLLSGLLIGTRKGHVEGKSDSIVMVCLVRSQAWVYGYGYGLGVRVCLVVHNMAKHATDTIVP